MGRFWGHATIERLAMVVVYVALVFGGSCAAPPANAGSGDEAEKASATVSEAFQNAYNSKDPAGISRLFLDGGVFLTPAGTMLTDPTEIEKAIAGRIAAGWTKETIRVISARPEGDDVLAFVEYTIAGEGPNAGKQLSGHVAQLLSKQGSTWRIKMLAANLKPVQDVTGMTAATGK